MALSGSVSTNSYEGRYYLVSWTATQSIGNNQSIVDWKLEAVGGKTGWYAERTLTLVINGNNAYSKTSRVERFAGEIANGSLVIEHNSNGDAIFSISLQAAVFVSTINCTASKTFTLDNIARKSALEVKDGILGVEQILNVNRKTTSFTHTITVVCGKEEIEICSKSNNIRISFVPPIEWAAQYTSETKVPVTYLITTYNGDTSIGSRVYKKTYVVPDSVKPECEVVISDAMGYAETYGGYIKNLSKFAVKITPIISCGSEIESYLTEVNKTTYNTPEFTTEVISSSGMMEIETTVKDERGRIGSSTKKVNVLDYDFPMFNAMSVQRCDEYGNDNEEGEYVKVTFSTSITSLNGQNSATYELAYKPTSESNFTKIKLNDYKNNYNVIDGFYVFEADGGKSYDVQIVANDNFKTAITYTSVSTAFATMHWTPSGRGIAFGKIAESEDCLDCGFNAIFRKESHFEEKLTYDIPMCNTNCDCNTMLTSGKFYIGTDASNKPENAEGWLEVQSYEDEETLHCFQKFTGNTGNKYERFMNAGEWGSWIYIDYIVESGTDGIWTYKKWNSGIAECWGTHTVTTTIDKEWGTFYESPEIDPVFFPFTFKEIPCLSITPASGSYVFFVEIGAGADTTKTGIMWFSRPTAVTSSIICRINIHAIGKWK